ncbi:hypothetical protein EDB86DRAFT_2908837 [Lactarius hatsudake]|nr:hypothetical protein EDB86DRAFT_2908837 [Lactarius hatsudake]
MFPPTPDPQRHPATAPSVPAFALPFFRSQTGNPLPPTEATRPKTAQLRATQSTRSCCNVAPAAHGVLQIAIVVCNPSGFACPCTLLTPQSCGTSPSSISAGPAGRQYNAGKLPSTYGSGRFIPVLCSYHITNGERDGYGVQHQHWHSQNP